MGKIGLFNRFFCLLLALFLLISCKKDDLDSLEGCQFKQRIAFFGDSLTAEGDWGRRFLRCRVQNFGVHGNTVAAAYERIGTIVDSQPDLVFLMIGINDILKARGDLSPLKLFVQIENIINTLLLKLPQAEVIVQSILPIGYDHIYYTPSRKENEIVVQTNALLKSLRTERVAFSDTYSKFVDANGELNSDYTIGDGLHLNEMGYSIWARLMKNHLTI